MKNFLINKKIFDELLFLLNNFSDNDMPPIDYVNMFQDKIQEEHYETVAEMFLLLIQLRQLLSDFINYFYCLGKRKDHGDKHFLMVLTFILINILNNSNKEHIIDICKEEKSQKVVNFLRFFNKESVVERLFLMGCQYFEEKYVKEKVVLHVKENRELSEGIQTYFEEILVLQKAEYIHEPTKPITPRVSIVMREVLPPPVPTNTPEEVLLPPAKPAPASTYQTPQINKVLMKLKNKHRTASQLLLEEANEATKHMSTAKSHKQHTCLHSLEKPALQHKKRYQSCKAIKTDVHVKKNTATVLREAARLINEEEKDIKRMNELVSGAIDHSSYEAMLDNLRAQEETLKLQDIERKHLLGQLTREEAILARQRILDINRAKRAQIEKEKKETEEILRQMQQKQEEEIRKMIDKTQQIQKNIEAKKQDMIQRKQLEAQEVAKTNKQLYAEAMMRQKQELEKRIEIIKEIKALSSIKDLQTNKFDPTETMNVGLLCEMSLVELHERLLLKRTSIREEIEDRQNCIRKQKLKQQQFLAETQQFINDCREQKKLLRETKDLTNKQLKTIETENQEILELRKKLERARQKRLEVTKN